MRKLAFVVPGRLETKTGGYLYDRRIVEGLSALGWHVRVLLLDEGFPFPSPEAREQAARVLASLPDGAVVVVDGLAMGAMPDQVERERRRLALVALVHHPLGAETGLDPAVARSLIESERRALACARMVVVTSAATAVSIEAMDVAPERVAVVEPGTDPAPVATGSGGPDVRLLTVATVSPRKGHALLVEALATLPRESWRLDCVGSRDRDPATAVALEAQIRRLGLTDRIRLLGELDADGLARCYDRADVFVLPTLYEGYGMAVAEALARGLPIVGTRTGAIPSLVPPEAGVLVPTGDIDALRAALAKVVGDAEFRRGLAQGARGVASRLPTWADASRAMAGLLIRVEETAQHG